MARALRICAGVVLSIPLAACESDMVVLGPTPPDQGIVIFIHADFAGSSQAIDIDVRDLNKTEGPCSTGAEGEVPSWRECVSSIRVFPAGLRRSMRMRTSRAGASPSERTCPTYTSCLVPATAASRTASGQFAC